MKTLFLILILSYIAGVSIYANWDMFKLLRKLRKDAEDEIKEMTKMHPEATRKCVCKHEMFYHDEDLGLTCTVCSCTRYETSLKEVKIKHILSDGRIRRSTI